MFLTLSKQMGNLRNTLNSQSEFAQSLALNIVTDLILPAVKWQAGRKNEAVRIAGNDPKNGPFKIFECSLKSIHLFQRLMGAMNCR